jgi:hypothetical protein
MSDIVGDRTVNVSDATVKLFVDSGVNLGGNDSLFSTGGKNSAHNISAISGGTFDSRWLEQRDLDTLSAKPEFGP